jgi:hypothetical protein
MEQLGHLETQQQSLITQQRGHQQLKKWIVSLRVEGSHKFKGVRSMVYEASLQSGAYFFTDLEAKTLFYEDKDLCARFVFFEETKYGELVNIIAYRFHNAMIDTNLIFYSVKVVDIPSDRLNAMGKYKYPRDTRSPDDTEASVFSASVVSDINQDWVLRQSIERILIKGNLEKAHLKHNSHGAPKTENNVLCLSKTIHFYFDSWRSGSHEGKPLMMIDGVYGGLDGKLHRIDLTLNFLTGSGNDVLESVQFLLKEGSSVDIVEGIKLLKTFVYVNDHVAFLANLHWKRDDTQRKWDMENTLMEDLANAAVD